MPQSSASKVKPLFGPLALLALAAVIGLLLLVLFPGRLPDRLPPLTPVVVAPPAGQLEALVAARPDDADARLALVRQRLAAGELDAADEALQPLLAGTTPTTPALRARLELDRARLAAAPGEPALRQTLEADLDRYEAQTDLDAGALAWLAARWLELEQPGRAARLSERLAVVQPEQAFEHFMQAGRGWLSANRAVPARAAYEAASAAAGSAAQKQEAIAAGLAVTRANAQPGAVDAARRLLANGSGEAALLDQAIAIALDNGDVGQAYEWSEQRIAQAPDDRALLRRHADLALAVRRPELAVRPYERYVARHPDDLAAQRELLRLEQWSGRPQQALAVLRQLAARAPDAATDAQLLALATSLGDAGAQLEAMRREAARRRLGAAEMQRYLDLIEREQGDPQAAIAALQAWLASGPEDRALRERLARLYDETDQPAQALAIWDDIALRHGRGLVETQARAGLQLRNWQLGAALATLLSLPADQANDSGYWRRLGELGWLRNDMASVQRGYGGLFEHRPELLDEEGAQRLIIAAGRDHDAERAAQVAMATWPRLRDPQLLLDALAAALRERRDEVAARLVAFIDAQPAVLASGPAYVPAYGRLRGDFFAARGQTAEALQSYERALALTPDDPALQAAVLYALIERGERDRLRRRLDAWQARLDGNPVLWQPYAVAYAQLGRPDLALPLFSRYALEHPDDALWLLSYADALDNARRFESARRIRDYALGQLRPRLLNADVRRSSPEQRDRDLRALLAQQARIGAAEDYAWLQRVLASADPQALGPRDHELLMDWHLSREQPDYLRYWLLRAQMRRLRIAPYLRLSSALASNQHQAIAGVLDEAAVVGISDRVEGERRANRGDRAQLLALARNNDREPWVRGVELLPRYAAEQAEAMPQHATLAVQGVNLAGMKFADELASVTASSKHWTLTARGGSSQLAGRDARLDLDGYAHEFRAGLKLALRLLRGTTTLAVDRVETRDRGFTQFALSQTLRLTERLTVRGFGLWREQSLDSAAVRALATRDSAGAGFGYRFSARDSLDVEARALRYRSRIDDAALGHGYQFSASLGHDLMVGRNYELQARLQASYLRNDLVAALPATLLARLPAGFTPGAFVASEFGLLGAGLRFAHGEPGGEFPLVGELRYVADLSLGYVFPRRGLAAAASFGIGSRVLGSDELSLQLGVDGTGAASTSISRSVGLQYRYFFGR